MTSTPGSPAPHPIASHNTWSLAPDAAVTADSPCTPVVRRLMRNENLASPDPVIDLTSSHIPTFLTDWPPVAPSPLTYDSLPSSPSSGTPELRYLTPEYHYNSEEDLCTMPCDLATILTLYGSSPPQSPTPIIHGMPYPTTTSGQTPLAHHSSHPTLVPLAPTPPTPHLD
jgi:hypothetical protein